MRGRWAAAAASVVVVLVGSGPVSAAPADYSAARSQPQADPYYRDIGSTSIDALHYGLELSWHDRSVRLVGTATIRFRVPRAESSIHLDLAAAMTVRTITLDGRDVRARHKRNDLDIATGTLKPGAEHTLVIRYAGHPHQVTAPTERDDTARVGWKTTGTGQVLAWQEPFGAFTWYPVNDHPSDKAYYDISVETRRDWRAVSNGGLRTNRIKHGRRVMHWHQGAPCASYLVTIAIGPFDRYRDEGPHGLPISYWVRPRDTHVLHEVHRLPNLLRWLEHRLGRYPFHHAGVLVVSPFPSAMETQTLVTIGPDALLPHFGAAVLLHEFAHQWYGDEVTPKDWTDLWLNESFAMYLQIRWQVTRQRDSMGFWRDYLADTDQDWRDEAGPPAAYDPEYFAATNVYYCGALMLDRIKLMIGPDAFDTLLRDWPRQHRFGNADRDMWIAWLNEVSGQDLTAFAEEWLLSPTSPA